MNTTASLKVSVIMPCYNGAINLVQSIESFLNQTYSNKELIIVDGKSTDGSHAIIEKYTQDYANILWVKQHDTCVTDGINIGIRESNGDFLGFLMTDDHFIYNEFFAECIQLAQLINYDVLYSNTYYYSTAYEKRSIHYWKPEHKLNRTDMLKAGTSVAIIDSTIIKRSVFDKQLLDPEYNLCSDYEFFLRIANDETLFMYLDRYTTCCLYKGDNLSFKHLEVQNKMFSKVSIKFLSDNVAESDYLLYHKIMSHTEKFTKEEISAIEQLFLKLIVNNRNAAFYSEPFFLAHLQKLWHQAVQNSGLNKIQTLKRIFSSPIYANFTKFKRFLLPVKYVLKTQLATN